MNPVPDNHLLTQLVLDAYDSITTIAAALGDARHVEETAYARAAFLEEAAGLGIEDLARLLAELSRQGGRLEAARDAAAARGGVRQLRLVVEADDFDRARAFYRDVLRMPEVSTFHGVNDQRGVVLAAGIATLELNTPAQKREVDRIEVGHPTLSPIRVALEVADADRTTSQVVEAGAVVTAPAVDTPWGSRNSRFQAPAGLELTVFHQR